MASKAGTSLPGALLSLSLVDVRILAVEQYGAGPWATAQLVELGADVIKIEDPRTGGDIGRYVPPFAEGEDSLFSAWRLSGPRREPQRAPGLGEHNAQILHEIGGYGSNEIQALATRGAFGSG
jgi:crotonobetainyl-CoA:carnitine CoA-transferase CaiB-like acyl-CoA transferase